MSEIRQSIHLELFELFQADQQERKDIPPYDTPEYWEMRRRDAQRRERVKEIVTAAPQEQFTGEDLYYAALVLHHGGDVDDVWQALQLAQKAADIGYRPARWLTAAATDRWLMVQGRPQKYGTQIVPDGRRYRVWDVDPHTTDAERARWDVRPLARQQARAAELTRTESLPAMDRAPDWLKAAIRRWQNEPVK